jgi:F0F1-type ATP synthase membrane subunit c/vacuolar-type H+-ATPase subunit K
MSAAGTDTQTVCLYSPITAITYSVNPSTSAVTGLPSGVTYDPNASPWPTISGNPTQSGVFTYTLTNGSCASTGTLTVNNCASPCQIDLTSAIGTDTQTVCINFPIAAISYSVTGAVSATVTGLPNGISFNSGTGVISGSPTVSGTFNYSVSSTGTCSAVQRFGQITVGSVYPVISGNSPTICTGKTATLTASGANTYIWSTGETTSSISKSPTTTTNYTVIGTTNGCKDTITQHIAVNSLTVIAGNSPTICSGQTATLTVSGTSSYVWSTGETTSSIIKAPTTTTTYSVTGTDALTGCSKTTTDFITVYNCSSPCQISLSSSLGTDTQTVCVNSPITSISYSVTGAASAMVAGLPNGITFNSGTGVISGSPTVSGTFNYSVSSTGTCNVAQKYGKITIDTLPIAYTGNGSDTICENASVTLGGLNSAANGAILWTENGAGNITSGATTLSPTYTSAAADAGNTLILTMTVTSTNSCAPQTATATYSVTVNPVPTATIIGTTYDLQNNILPKLIFMGMRGVTPYTFSYSINGGTTQTLSTITGDINVPVTAATSYTYSLLQVQDNNGCNQTNPALSDSVIFTINPPTSINGINESITAAAFPNPFSNQLRVVVEEKSSVKITDVMGKQVYSDIFESGSNTIETANLNSGLYFITITNNMGAVTKKVIKN